MSKKYDALLLLGLKLNEDGTPKHELKLRIAKAAECYHRGLAGLIIPCGGRTPGTPVTEADVMKAELIRLGVNESDIHCEDKSQITVENFINARAMLPQGKMPHVLIVTSDYHMLRSRLICRYSAGMHASGKKAHIPLKYKRVAIHNEPLHLIDYVCGYQSGKRNRPQLYLNIMHKLLK